MKNQQHFYCPRADAPYRSKSFDDLFIGQIFDDTRRRHYSGNGICSEVLDRSDLCARKARTP